LWYALWFSRYHFLIFSILLIFNWCVFSQDGKVVGDAAVGAAIANAISAMPHLNTAALEPLAASSMQDLLMSMYLSNLTNTHIQLADRIHSLAMFQSQ
jgi:hypothetical protein